MSTNYECSVSKLAVLSLNNMICQKICTLSRHHASLAGYADNTAPIPRIPVLISLYLPDPAHRCIVTITMANNFLR